MKKFFITALLLLIIGLSFTFTTPVSAQETRHYATCDVCGFCVTTQDSADWVQITPPGNWEQCRKCLYENASQDPKSGDTLLVNPDINTPPTPMPGRHFSVFGCIKTDLSDFTQTGAASSLVQVLLNLIFMMAGGIALLYIIYGAYLVMTSQADPERLAYGKRVVVGSIVGLILVLSSVFIVNLLAAGVLRLPGFGNR
jgi:hypothetical protein